MKTRILLIVQDEKDREIYLEAMQAEDVEVFVSPSLLNFPQDICDRTYHGIFLDLATKMKALRHSKSYIYGLQEKFPTCQLKIDEATGQVRCLYSQGDNLTSPLDFIYHACRDFVPASIRSDVRKTIHFPALIYRNPEAGDPERSATIDMGRGGCFLFSTQPREVDEEIWIRFPDLQDPAPIKAVIRKVIHWGESLRIPGIGVAYQDISLSQTEEILDRFLSSE